MSSVPYVLSVADADHLKDWEDTPNPDLFTVDSIEVIESNDYEDRVRYTINVDGDLYSAVFYTGSSADAYYWESAIRPGIGTEGVTFSRWSNYAYLRVWKWWQMNFCHHFFFR